MKLLQKRFWVTGWRLWALLAWVVGLGVGVPPRPALAVPIRAAPTAPNTWTMTGSMAIDRFAHTATLLPNGKVLIVGGHGSGIYLNSAELFDPMTGSWSAARNVGTPRYGHTATMLPNGKVLIVGGYSSGNGFLRSAMLYDSNTGTWSATGSLNIARYVHSATLLQNGKVLVVGGINGAYLNSVEIYDPATETWSFTGNLNTLRGRQGAVLLPNGDVLITGGVSVSGHLTGTEIYNSVTGVWRTVGGLNVARESHTATLLPDGRILVVGGANGSILASAELYDPATELWVSASNLSAARYHPSTVLLPNGKVLVTGGDNSGGTLASTELYDPETGLWSPASAMNATRYSHTATLLADGKVLVSGGHSNAPASAELYDSSSSAWSATGSMSIAHSDHTATLLPNGKVLLAGGVSITGSYLAIVELYDRMGGTWSPTGSLNTARRFHTATLLPNGKVLVAGGENNSGALASAELYDSTTGMWANTGSLNVRRTRHTATLLPNGKVLVIGGNTSAELYDPATGTWSLTGNLAFGRSAHTATLLPNGKVLVAGGCCYLTSAELYDPATGIWSLTGNLNAMRNYHTATLLPNGKVLVAGGQITGYASITNTEIYDVATGAWTNTASLNFGRYAHTATLLPNGKVLIAGGWNGNSTLTNSTVYDPATGTWGDTNSLNTARYMHTATMLSNGKLLVTGGFNGTYLNSAELYDMGLGFSLAWQPTLNPLPPSPAIGQPLTATGTNWRGYGNIEASGGGYNNSSTNYPLVQITRLDNAQTVWLPTVAFSATALTTLPLGNFPPGPAQLRVFVNGIPSDAQFVQVYTPTVGTTILDLLIFAGDNDTTSTTNLGAWLHDTVSALLPASRANPNKTVILLMDRGAGQADKVYKIQNGLVTPVTWPAMPTEVNVTDPATLAGFIQWARATYPADKTALSFLGHGLYAAPDTNWNALSPTPYAPTNALFPFPTKIWGDPDYTDSGPRGVLSVYALGEALRLATNDGANKLDVLDLVMCYQLSVEVLAQVYPYAHSVVGGPGYVYFAPALPAAGLQALDPAQSPTQMAAALVNAYDAKLEEVTGGVEHPRVLAAVDTAQVELAVDRTNLLAYWLLQDLANPANRAAAHANLLAANQAILHYDANNDFVNAAHDPLIDAPQFFYRLSELYDYDPDISSLAFDAAEALTRTVLARAVHSGSPWFKPTTTWNFAGASGLAMYGDWQGVFSPTTGLTELSAIAHWYTGTVSSDNPHPFAFVSPNVHGATWGDVLTSYWATASLTTTLYIPLFPPVQESGELAALGTLLPRPSSTYRNTPVTPTVFFSTSTSVHSILIPLTITQNSGIVFTDTLSVDFRLPGSYALSANRVWTPTTQGPYTLTYRVDARNQVREENKSNNTYTQTGSVQLPGVLPAISATTAQQWFTAPSIPVQVAATSGTPTRLRFEVWAFASGSTPNTQTGTQVSIQTLNNVTLPNTFGLALPANASAGVYLIRVWPSGGGSTGLPVDVLVNYIPANAPIAAGQELFFRFNANAGDNVALNLNTLNPALKLYAWEPSNPWTAQMITGTGTLSLNPTEAGEYVVSVYNPSVSAATFTLSATRNGGPMLPTLPATWEARPRPTFIDPIPFAPQFVYVPFVGK